MRKRKNRIAKDEEEPLFLPQFQKFHDRECTFKKTSVLFVK